MNENEGRNLTYHWKIKVVLRVVGHEVFKGYNRVFVALLVANDFEINVPETVLFRFRTGIGWPNNAATKVHYMEDGGWNSRGVKLEAEIIGCF